MRVIRRARLWLVALPYLILFVGGTANQIVLHVNGGKFPVQINPTQQVGKVDVNGMLDAVHCVMTSQTRLNWLGDWIDLVKEVDSPGDLLIDLGLFLQYPAFLLWAFILSSEAIKREPHARYGRAHYCSADQD